MAKIKGILEAANTTLVLTPLADTSVKTGAERWMVPSRVHRALRRHFTRGFKDVAHLQAALFVVAILPSSSPVSESNVEPVQTVSVNL